MMESERLYLFSSIELEFFFLCVLQLLLTEAGDDLVVIFTNMRWIKLAALLIRSA